MKQKNNRTHTAKKSIEEIKEILKMHKSELKQKFAVKKIGIFGSYVRGEQRGRSDVDVLVEFNELPDVFLMIDLEDYIKNLLKTKVDLVRKNAIRPELKDIISAEVVYI